MEIWSRTVVKQDATELQIPLLPPISFKDSLLLTISVQQFPLESSFKRFRYTMAAYASFPTINTRHLKLMLAKLVKKQLIHYNQKDTHIFPVLTILGKDRVFTIIDQYNKISGFVDAWDKFNS